MSERPQNRHLRPARRGEIRNPEGRNQFSYRRDFETTINKLLIGTVTEEERQTLGLPRYLEQLASQGITRGELIAHITVHRAMANDERHLWEVLRRLWVVSEKHEQRVTVESAPVDDDALVARLAQLAAQRSRAGGDR